MNATATDERKDDDREERGSTRTCIGCSARDDKEAMVRLVVAAGEVVFHPSFEPGRGAHLHPRASCVQGAARGLGRAFKGAVRMNSAELGARLVSACERRMVGLLLAARRRGDLAIGTEASARALQRAAPQGAAPLVVVAVDAGAARRGSEVERAIASGNAFAWKTKSELGGLLGAEAVAVCVVSHGGIAAELRFLRGAVDAGTAAPAEDAECSRLREAR